MIIKTTTMKNLEEKFFEIWKKGNGLIPLSIAADMLEILRPNFHRTLEKYKIDKITFDKYKNKVFITLKDYEYIKIKEKLGDII